jgi:hypothetical protein
MRHKVSGSVAKMAENCVSRGTVRGLANRWFQPLTHVSSGGFPRVSELSVNAECAKRDIQSGSRWHIGRHSMFTRRSRLIATKEAPNGARRPDDVPDPRRRARRSLGLRSALAAGQDLQRQRRRRALLESGARVIIVDPLDVWWGLRLTAAGGPSKFTLVVFGGEHGDMPLFEHSGALIGETVGGMGRELHPRPVQHRHQGSRAPLHARFLDRALQARQLRAGASVVRRSRYVGPAAAARQGRRGGKAARHDGNGRSPRPHPGLHSLADHAAAGGAEQRCAEPGRRAGRVQAHQLAGP